MMRSLYSGVSGLRNHQTRMDVIGNNMANVNTVGFKAGRANFQDVLSQTLQGATSAQGNRGGTNAMQVGLGVGMSTIDTIFTDGTYQSTGSQTDLAIQGQGFFVLQDLNGNEVYTRAGNFDYDTEGNYIVPGSGYKVIGYLADANGNITSTKGAIQIPKESIMRGDKTSILEFAQNLSANAANGTTVQASQTIYDTEGKGHQVTVTYTKTSDAAWLYKITDPNGIVMPETQLGQISFKNDGTVDTVKTIQPVLPNPYRANISTLQMDSTDASSQTKAIKIIEEDGTEKSFTITFTEDNTTTNKWAYSIAGTTPPKNGEITYTAADGYKLDGKALNGASALSFSYTNSSGASKDVTVSFGDLTTTAPAAGVFALDNDHNAPIKNLAAINAFQLNNTKDSVQNGYFTVYDDNKVPHVFEIAYTNTGDNAWSYQVTEPAAGVKVLTNGTITFDPATKKYLSAGVDLTSLTIPYTDSANATATAAITFAGGIAPDVNQFAFSADSQMDKTSIVAFKDIQLDTRIGSTHDKYITVLDSELTPRVFKLSFTKTATENDWAYKLTEPAVSDTKLLSSGNIKWDTTTSKYTGLPSNFTYQDTSGTVTVQLNNSALTGSAIKPPTDNAFVLASDATYGTGETQTSSFYIPKTGKVGVPLSLNMEKITQLGGDSTVKVTKADGYAQGVLQSTNIDGMGIITGTYDNGQSRNIAQVALAMFNNPGGLMKLGDTMFSASNNSGDARLDKAGVAGRGTINPSSLEMSNVDLAQEMSNMIMTQRGFQTNSKIISVADEMLQELANLKR